MLTSGKNILRVLVNWGALSRPGQHTTWTRRACGGSVPASNRPSEDNLLTVGCGVRHHGIAIDIDEELSPSLENTIAYLWLKPGLPTLVKHIHGSELRKRSLAAKLSHPVDGSRFLTSRMCYAMLQDGCPTVTTWSMVRLPLDVYRLSSCEIPARLLCYRNIT